MLNRASEGKAASTTSETRYSCRQFGKVGLEHHFINRDRTSVEPICKAATHKPDLVVRKSKKSRRLEFMGVGIGSKSACAKI